MKKFSLIVVLCLFSWQASLAQPGLGAGSSGLVVKTGPESKYGLIGRINAQLGTLSTIIPQLNVIRRFVNEEKAKFYGGLGVGAQVSTEDSFDRLAALIVRVPLGVEYFPFQTKPFSLGVEGGLALVGAEAYTVVSFTSAFEFTYYFGKRKKDY